MKSLWQVILVGFPNGFLTELKGQSKIAARCRLNIVSYEGYLSVYEN